MHPQTSCETISEYIVKSGILTDPSHFIIRKLVRADQDLSLLSFVSFKLSIIDTLFDAVSDPAFWPKNVGIREFVPKPKQPSGVIMEPPELSDSISNRNKLQKVLINDQTTVSTPSISATSAVERLTSTQPNNKTDNKRSISNSKNTVLSQSRMSQFLKSPPIASSPMPCAQKN